MDWIKELEKKTSVVCDDRHAGSNTFVRRHEKCRGLQYYGVVGEPCIHSFALREESQNSANYENTVKQPPKLSFWLAKALERW